MPSLVENGLPRSGTTAQRPTNAEVGQSYFDTTIGADLVWNGSAWVSPGGAAPSNGAVAGTGTTAVERGDGVIHQTVITMADLPVTVGNTTGISFGGTKIYDFPVGRILILGATCDGIAFDLTDDGNVTPLEATDGGDIAVGTTAPTDGSLTLTDVDIIPSTSIDPISGGVDGAALAASAHFDGTATAKDAFFNIIIDDADVADGASDVILVSGTVTITWINLGDY